MNVPSQYKGFSKLPEDVQRKMDPDLAQKYMGGGSVMARPLFRQAGGPVAAQMPMPQQQMPMDPALMDQAAMIQNTVADQANTMTAEYIQNQLAQLDSAETSEDAINAIRGNQKPLEERYRELADLVGEEDAGQTPQSVLTLVQPVMLMTEQGAMDSGLGQLMQGLIGEVDMMTEGGEPTDMGQGIGSLMMAGAAEEPMGVGQQPVANFSQGGAVQRFQEGGEASRLQQIYSEMLPVYQSILGDLDERRRLTQSQILFDIADRAGAFAAGIDPRTGQRISGSPAAQLAGAMSGLGGQIGERLGSLEEADQRLRLAALQGAQSEYSAERAAARAAAGRERGIGNAYEAVDAQGNVIATEFLANRDDLDAFRAAYPDATIRAQQAPAEMGPLYDVVGPDGQVITTLPLNTMTDYNRVLEQYPGATIREAREPTVAELDKLYDVVGQDGRVITTLPINTVDEYTRVQTQYPNARIREAVEPEGPGAIGSPYVAVNEQGQVVGRAFLADEADLERFQAEYPGATIREEQETPGTVDLYNPNDLNAPPQTVPLNSLEYQSAIRMGYRPLADIQTISGLTESGAIGKSYQAVDAEGNVLGTRFMSTQDQLAEFQQEFPGATIRETQAPVDTTPRTLIERQQAAITNQETLDNLENLPPDKLSQFATNVAAFIRETTSPAGVSSRLPLPPNTQEAMRRAHAAGISFPGIDPSLFGAAPREEELEATGLELLDPTTNLSKATGLLSGLQRGINFLGEQASEIIGGEGTMFKDTAQGSAALDALLRATNRFYLEGRTLALEFSLLQEELVRPSLLQTDSGAVRALTNQRNLLQGDLERLQAILDNPSRYTNADISKARQLSTYASQLLATYDEFINAYQRQEGPVSEERRDRILNDPAFALTPQE